MGGGAREVEEDAIGSGQPLLLEGDLAVEIERQPDRVADRGATQPAQRREPAGGLRRTRRGAVVSGLLAASTRTPGPVGKWGGPPRERSWRRPATSSRRSAWRTPRSRPFREPSTPSRRRRGMAAHQRARLGYQRAGRIAPHERVEELHAERAIGRLPVDAIGGERHRGRLPQRVVGVPARRRGGGRCPRRRRRRVAAAAAASAADRRAAAPRRAPAAARSRCAPRPRQRRRRPPRRGRRQRRRRRGERARRGMGGPWSASVHRIRRGFQDVATELSHLLSTSSKYVAGTSTSRALPPAPLDTRPSASIMSTSRAARLKPTRSRRWRNEIEA